MSDPTRIPLPESPVLASGSLESPLAMDPGAVPAFGQAAAPQTADARRLELLEQAVIGLTHVLQQQQQPPPARAFEPGRTSLRMHLPSYHGTEKENVVSWLDQVENVFRGERIADDARRIAYAVSAMKDAAFEWYRAEVRMHEFDTWVDFVDDLKRAFLPPNHQHLFRRQLKQCKQQGSVQDYVFRFRSILGQIEEMNELDQVDHFVNGLKPQTAAEVQYRCPNTLEEAISVAIMYDAARFHVGNGRLRGGPVANNNLGRPSFGFGTGARRSSHPPLSPMSLDFIKSSTPTDRQTAIKNRLCFRCNQPGHVSRNCPKRFGPGPIDSGNGRQQ